MHAEDLFDQYRAKIDQQRKRLEQLGSGHSSHLHADVTREAAKLQALAVEFNSVVMANALDQLAAATEQGTERLTTWTKRSTPSQQARRS